MNFAHSSMTESTSLKPTILLQNISRPARKSRRFHRRRVADRLQQRLPQHTSRRNNSTALRASATGVRLAKDIYCAQPWWTRNLADNMVHISSPEQMLHALSTAGNRLVVIDFYAKWCLSCRALHPKLSQICKANPNITLLKVDWDENMELCKVMGVKALPFFHLYRRPFGRQASFTISVSRIAKLRDAITLYGVPLEESEDYPGSEDVNSIDLYLDEDLKSVSGQLQKIKTIFSTSKRSI